MSVVEGADAWLRYKRRLLQALADHPPRMELEELPRPPPDLPVSLRYMVRGASRSRVAVSGRLG